MNLGREVHASLRQRRFRKQWRIAPRELPADIGELVEFLRAEAASRQGVPHGPMFDDHAVAEAATGLFNARRRMLVPGTDEPHPDYRIPAQHLHATWRAFKTAEVTIQDHTGTPFDGDLTLRVVGFETRAGIEFDQVIETIRPSVYVHDRLIQAGEVIVGTPPDTQRPDPRSDDEDA